MKNTLVLLAAMALSAAPSLVNAQIVTWTAASSPVQSTLAGGPWTLSQGTPTTTYCTNGGTGTPIVNPLSTVNTMNRFYLPFVTGSGNNLQGYFDCRPDAIDEASSQPSPPPARPLGMTWAKDTPTPRRSSAQPGCTSSTGETTMSTTLDLSFNA